MGPREIDEFVNRMNASLLFEDNALVRVPYSDDFVAVREWEKYLAIEEPTHVAIDRGYICGLGKIVWLNIAREEQAKEVAPYIEKYEQWSTDICSKLSAALEGNFPNRWELISKDPAKSYFGDSFYVALAECGGDVLNLRGVYSDMLSGTCHNITIHFPEILISNSAGQEWTIRDYYVLIELDIKFRMRSILGYRATKTWNEHRCMYTHSHSKCGGNELVNFCFGSTALDTLVSELRSLPFDLIKFELLLQNLPDYLSWESKEGVPYKSISALLMHTEDRNNQPEISSGMIVRMTEAIRMAGLPLPVVISFTGEEYLVELPRSVELLRMITPHAPRNLRFPLMEGSLRSSYTITMSREEILVHVNRINEESSPRITFKGVHVPYVILPNNDEDIEEGKKKEELFADTRILDAVCRSFVSNIQGYLNDSYWYGTEERAVSKNGATR